MDLRTTISDDTISSSTNEKIDSSTNEKIDIDEIIQKLSNCSEKIQDDIITLADFRTKCTTLIENYREFKRHGVEPDEEIVEEILNVIQAISVSSVNGYLKPLVSVLDKIIKEEDWCECYM